jgi:hypothetical protein
VADVRSEQAAITRGIQFACGTAYRIEFFHDERFYSQEKPFRTIEQSAFPGFQRQIYSQKEQSC